MNSVKTAIFLNKSNIILRSLKNKLIGTYILYCYHPLNLYFSWVWRCSPVIPDLRRLEEGF